MPGVNVLGRFHRANLEINKEQLKKNRNSDNLDIDNLGPRPLGRAT